SNFAVGGGNSTGHASARDHPWIFYPVFPPDRHADELAAWLEASHHRAVISSPLKRPDVKLSSAANSPRPANPAYVPVASINVHLPAMPLQWPSLLDC